MEAIAIELGSGDWTLEVRISSVARYTGLVTPELTEFGPDGELVSGVALTQDGRLGPALAFDGSGYVKLTDEGDFLKEGAAKRTIELWVKATSTSGTKMLYEEGGSTSGFALRIDEGVLQFTAKTGGGTPKTVSAAYTSTAWHKVTAVYDGSTTSGTMTLYVDDSQVATDANVGFNSVAAQVDGAALGGTLGSDAFGGSSTGGSFAGSLDAVRVFNDAVVPGELDVTETDYVYNERNQLDTETVTPPVGDGWYNKYFYNNNGENTSIEKRDLEDNVIQTTTMTYDDFGRMLTWTDGTNTETHTYRGAEWHRASTATGGTTTYYLYDGDNVVGDLVSGAFTRQYVTPFLDENLSMTVIGGPQAGTYYYNRDGLGSVRNLTDASQNIKNTYAYTAFGQKYGEIGAEAVPQRYTFTGREAAGQAAAAGGAPMYYRYRMYSATLGRFGRRDPRLGGDRLFNAYTRTSPTVSIDPFGLEPVLCCCDPEQVDIKNYVNTMVNNVIRAAHEGPGANPVRDAIYGQLISGGGGLLTGIEKKLKDAIKRGVIPGKQGPRITGTMTAFNPFTGKHVTRQVEASSADCVVVCGECIGTDKLGHFFEEGLTYYRIMQSKGTEYAKAWGYFSEGLTPPPGLLTPNVKTWLTSAEELNLAFAGSDVKAPVRGTWGLFGDQVPIGSVADPRGAASPADIAANEAGLDFWKNVAAHKGPVVFSFDVCQYVSAKWGHCQGQGANVPGASRESVPFSPPPAGPWRVSTTLGTEITAAMIVPPPPAEGVYKPPPGGPWPGLGPMSIEEALGLDRPWSVR